MMTLHLTTTGEYGNENKKLSFVFKFENKINIFGKIYFICKHLRGVYFFTTL